MLVLSLMLLPLLLWVCPQGSQTLPCHQRRQQVQWRRPCPHDTGSRSLSPVAAVVVAAAVCCAHSTPRVVGLVPRGRALSAPMQLQEGSPRGCCCVAAVLAAAGVPMQRRLMLPRTAGRTQQVGSLLVGEGRFCCPVATQMQAAGLAAAGGSHHQTLALCQTCHHLLCRLHGRLLRRTCCCHRILCHPHIPCLLHRTGWACPCHLLRAYPSCCWMRQQQLRTRQRFCVCVAAVDLETFPAGCAGAPRAQKKL